MRYPALARHFGQPLLAWLPVASTASFSSSRDETGFYWRLYCVYGVMLYVQADTGKIQTLAGRNFDTSRPDIALKYVLSCLTAGMKASPVV